MREVDRQTVQRFRGLINLSRQELEAWLTTDESQSVGIVIGTTRTKKVLGDGNESVGHAMGRYIVWLLGQQASAYTADDFRQMRKVCGYIRRHQAQVPAARPLEKTRWRYALMNWGYDPCRQAEYIEKVDG